MFSNGVFEVMFTSVLNEELLDSTSSAHRHRSEVHFSFRCQDEPTQRSQNKPESLRAYLLYVAFAEIFSRIRATSSSIGAAAACCC